MTKQVSGVEVKIGANATELNAEFAKSNAAITAALNSAMTKLAEFASKSAEATKKVDSALQSTSTQFKVTADSAGKMSATVSQSMGKVQSAASTMASKHNKSIGSMSSGISGLMGKVVALATAYLSLRTIKDVINDTVELNTNTNKLAQNLGVTNERASAYREAIRLVNIPVGTFNQAIKTMESRLARNESRLTKWGVQTRDQTGHLKDQQQIYLATIKAVGEYKDGSDRAAAGMAIFGTDLNDTNKILQVGSVALKSGAENAKQFGTVVTDASVAQAYAWKNSMGQMETAMDGLKMSLAGSLMPVLMDAVNWISSNLPAGLAILKTVGSVIISVLENAWDVGSYVFSGLKGIMTDTFGSGSTDAGNWANFLTNYFNIVKAAIIVIIGVFKIVGSVVAEAGQLIGIWVGLIIKSLNDLGHMRPGDITGNIREAMEDAVNVTAQAGQKIAASLQKIKADLTSTFSGKLIAQTENPFSTGTSFKHPDYKPKPNDVTPVGTKQVTTENQRGGGKSKKAESDTALIKAQLNAQLADLKENQKEEKAVIDDQLSQNTISYGDYYQKLGDIQHASMAQEIKAKTDELNTLQVLETKQTKPDGKIKVQAQIVKAQSDLNILKKQENQIDVINANLLRDKLEGLRKMRDSLMADVSDAVGVTDVNAKFKVVEDQFKELKARLSAEGDTGGLSALEKLLGYKKAQLEMTAFEEKYTLMNTQISTQMSELDIQAKKNGTTNSTLAKQKLDLQQQELDGLLKLKQAQLDLATATYGAGSVQVATIQASIAALKDASTSTNEFAKGVKDTIGSSLQGMFSNIMSGTKSAKDIFKDFLSSILQGIAQIAAKLMSEDIMKKIDAMSGAGGGAGGAAAGGAGGGWGAAIGAIMGAFADGGMTSAGKPYLVGERGPELFVPKTSGDIVNARQASALTGNKTSILNFNLSTPDPHTFRKTQTQTMADISRAIGRANSSNN